MRIKQKNGLVRSVKHRGPCSFLMKRRSPYWNEQGQRVTHFQVNLGAGLVIYEYKKTTFIDRLFGVR